MNPKRLKIARSSKHWLQKKSSLPTLSIFVDYILDNDGLAPQSHLSLLEPVQNAEIRMCTGAFRTSPVFSLCAEAGIPPLHYRRHIHCWSAHIHPSTSSQTHP